MVMGMVPMGIYHGNGCTYDNQWNNQNEERGEVIACLGGLTINLRSMNAVNVGL